MDAHLRRALAADAAAVAGVHVAGWRDGYAGLLPDAYLAGLDDAACRARWEAQLGNPDRETVEFVAEAGVGVIGFVSVGPSADQDARGAGEVWDLFVAHHAWGSGVGTRLLGAGLDALAQRGFTEAVVWVLAGNARATTCYRRAGFAFDQLVRRQREAGFVMVDNRFRMRLAGTPAQGLGA